MRFLLVPLLALMAMSSSAQNLASTYLQGSLGFDESASFHNKGTYSYSHPEALASQCMWSDGAAVYMFGGTHAQTSQANSLELNNRLWKYTPNNGWELLKGSTGTVVVTTTSSTPVYNGSSDLIYGSPGTASPTNLPGARAGASYTSDGNGGFFMYGGYGLGYNGGGKAVGVLEDLWYFDGTNWTSLMDYVSVGRSAVYGTQGQSNSTNTPGSRVGAALWYKDGHLYLFGGCTSPFNTTASIGPTFGGLTNMNGKSDLWRFDLSTNQWTWIDGATTSANFAIQSGTNYTNPPSTSSASYCIGANGDFYLYGGYEYWTDVNGTKYYSPAETLWKYNVDNGWSLVVGNPNSLSGGSTTTPGWQINAPLIEFNGSLYFFPGLITFNGPQNTTTVQSVVYKWDGTNWQSVKTCATSSAPGLAYRNDACLGKVAAGAVVLFNGEVFHYGGVGESSPIKYSASLTRFDGQNFAAVSSLPANTSNYFNSATTSVSKPGSLNQAASAYNEETRTLFVYGGDNYKSGLFSNLWKYQDGQWVWLTGSGASSTTKPVYGTQGQESATVTPGSRMAAAMWCTNGYVWLFGGRGYDVNGSLGRMSDLFRYNIATGQWAWIKGPKTISGAGTFGTKGVAGASNNPPGLSGMRAWKPKVSGNTVYIYGGIASGTNDYHDAVWKFDGVDWTWTTGSNTAKAVPVSLVSNTYNSSNTPGARLNFAFAQDTGGFYIYGGEVCLLKNGSSTPVANNQLWHFDKTKEQWKFITGSFEGLKNTATYSTSTLNLSTLTPGYVRGASAWTYEGRFYLLGGQAYTTKGLKVSSNLWEWNGFNWAWLRGGKDSAAIQQSPVYSEPMEFDYEHLPYPRYYALNWREGDVFYLAKGASTSLNSLIVSMDDIWAFEPGNVWNGLTWSKNFIPASKSVNAQILSSASVPNDIQVRSLLVDANHSLNMGGNRLKIAGDLFNYSGIENFDEIHFNGNDSQMVRGGLLEVSTTLVVEEQSILKSEGNIRARALDTANYGQIVNWGEIIGDVDFEFYIPLASTSSNGRYMHLGSIFDGATINLIKSSASGIVESGLSNAAQNTIWRLNAANASWQSPSLSDPFAPGVGYAIYAGINPFGNFLLSNGTSGSLRMRGQLSNANTVTISLNYNDGLNGSVVWVSNVDQAKEGWNFVANPFSHSINIGSLLNGLNYRSIYIWNGKENQYASINTATLSANNGGSLFIPPGQGFYFQYSSNDQQTKPSIQLDRSSLYSSTRPHFQKNSGLLADGIRFQILYNDSVSSKDDVWLGFEADATAGFDPKYDAWKIRSAGSKMIYVYSQGQEHSISTFNPDSVTYVDLGIVAQHGDTLYLTAMLANLRAFNEVELEDLKTNLSQDLVEQSQYSFVHDTAHEHRLRVHFSVNNVSVHSSPYKSGFIFYNQNSGTYLHHIAEEKEQAVEVQIYSMSGKLVESLGWDSPENDLEILKAHVHGLYIVKIKNLKSRSTEVLKVLKVAKS